ncbi:ergothioneine biosynthesis glutamate--cysteine ligase EgtA [Modestobacter sp. I12A-02628]|uniref:Glutamate--cysteine ligase EgtA n=1 Tax=Goekera deserti TaxID=2497753 RepID=A0A7K3WHM6_9ACTN|nr:ergothioneine biosynthesis glutamate--cysteine ligase EgtA [Goekera deserti]MPQ97749.1 ergothioneine biosynthesis glutamate--cysteine ligase EgtA [Goekera deserti]NDI48394.1 ergothioneine biosynthesis glutamate--cysteine ligase EgtA [Goekera deserti]NEL55995.1 ergothioneine biosynthesis glutamate--cysteine ligase EgtA [Goekera deserti]
MLSSPSRTLDLDGALEHVATGALRDTVPGPVGLELEAHLVDLTAPAERVGWDRLTGVVDALPALPGGSRVTLEPGGQVELSGPPLADAPAAVAALRADTAVVRTALAAARLGLAPVGTDPLRPARRVSPGGRYVAMEAHFAAVHCPAAGAAMMTSTASLQVNLEAGPEAGWTERVQRTHRLGPVLVAVSACSPLLAGAETGWRSSRQQVWGDLDQARCGPLLGRRDPATEWAEYALAAPVMLVAGDDGTLPVTDRTPFAAWVRGEVPLAGRRPTVADLDRHLTTLFPPVRLRGFLEIRYLDAAPEPWWPALAAVVATLLDDSRAADAAADACEPVSGLWDVAAARGLADPRLAAAAGSCLELAERHAPAALRPEVSALAGLVDQGRCPGDDLLHTARTRGAEAALVGATRLPEEER